MNARCRSVSRGPRSAAWFLPFVLGLAALVPCAAAGQDEPLTTVPGTDPEWAARIIAEEQDDERQTLGITRLRASDPQLLSVGLGAIWARQPKGFSCAAACEYRGPTFQIEPGIGGGQISAGYAYLIAHRAAGRPLLSEVYVGVGVKGALLRTWGDTPVDPAGQTFVGVEGEFTITRFNFSLGVLYGVSDSSRDDPWRATFGLGWGF